MTTQSITSQRELHYATPGIPASDGAGMSMTRIIGSPQLNMLDPFLLLDAFGSDKPDDYLAGFPTHPHRGFETVTYMLAGKMRHKDNAGNEGVIEKHGVQWMSAGRGILHSEMPEQTEGLLKGFQLWVNLPKTHKMMAPKYQEFPAAEIAEESHQNGTHIRVIAGTTNAGTTGPVRNEFIHPTYMDVTLRPGESFQQDLATEHIAFIYMIEGKLTVGDEAKTLKHKTLGVLTQGETVSVVAGQNDTRFLLIAGKPLNEPVARGGPFVMNTKAEIMQAFNDYQNNKF
ncbi:quercetin 2,3-dioxygenase [Thalassotalea sp. 42_200_T64]|nr:quercetin 2,3-dioxygenase [Thalassotalea sp. 42_200_T64]